MALKDIATTAVGKARTTVITLLEKMAVKGEVSKPSRGTYALTHPVEIEENQTLERWWER
jgi:hypothetical protein